MALPASGSISLAQVRTELSLSGAISLGQAEVRNLAGVASGAISMSNLHGKSASTHTLTVGTWVVNGINQRGYNFMVTGAGSMSGMPAILEFISAANNVNLLIVNAAGQRASVRVDIPGLGAVTVALTYDSKLDWSVGHATLTGIYNFLNARVGQTIPVNIT